MDFDVAGKMVLDGTPFLGPLFVWSATTIGGLVVAFYLSVSSKTPRERDDWSRTFLLFLVISLTISPFVGLVHL